ncbi:uncharacterized protein LOC143180198 [Calliopsis andreniformis]|uniref:uncharacterized protein LOC143180198 n=1 Tax=Calliopsis andreniformis TaxID=337506 RepID=UPI003FCE32B3
MSSASLNNNAKTGLPRVKRRTRNWRETGIRKPMKESERKGETERSIYGRKAFAEHIFTVNGVEVVIFALLVSSSSGANISASPLITGFQRGRSQGVDLEGSGGCAGLRWCDEGVNLEPQGRRSVLSGGDREDAIASEDSRRRRRRVLHLEVSRGYLVRLVGARGPGDWDGKFSAPYKRRDKRQGQTGRIKYKRSDDHTVTTTKTTEYSLFPLFLLFIFSFCSTRFFFASTTENQKCAYLTSRELDACYD